MAKGVEVLTMLIPDGGWVITGENFEGIEFLECEPITKAQYEAGFAQFDAWKTQQDAKAATDKAAILAKLGITEEELKIALG